ncbi:MAG: hypothetical protein EOO41_03635, partial [Methanobacteriota archaeon]
MASVCTNARCQRQVAALGAQIAALTVELEAYAAQAEDSRAAPHEAQHHELGAGDDAAGGEDGVPDNEAAAPSPKRLAAGRAACEQDDMFIEAAGDVLLPSRAAYLTLSSTTPTQGPAGASTVSIPPKRATASTVMSQPTAIACAAWPPARGPSHAAQDTTLLVVGTADKQLHAYKHTVMHSSCGDSSIVGGVAASVATSGAVGPALEEEAPMLLGSVPTRAPVLSLAIQPAAPGDECARIQTVATAHMDGSVCLWHMSLPPADAGAACETTTATSVWPADGACVHLGQHSKYATRVCWSPCGMFLASCSMDGSVAVYYVAARAASSSVSASSPPVCVQRMYFNAAVGAITWVSTTLLIAVSKSPVLWHVQLCPEGVLPAHCNASVWRAVPTAASV